MPGGDLAVLVLHTLRTQLEHSDLILSGLAEHASVHRIDLPGHGHSSRPASGDYSAQSMAETVGGVIGKLDLNRVVLVGESIGGALAMLVAARMPDRVAAVVASNPYDYPSAIIGGRLGPFVTWAGKHSSMIAAGDRAAVLGMVLRGGVVNDDALSKKYLETLAKTARDEKGFGRAQRAVLRASNSWSTEAAATYPLIPATTPTALLYGDHDWSSEAHRALDAARIPSVDDYTTMTNTGHFAMRDNPSAVVKAALPFITDRE